MTGVAVTAGALSGFGPLALAGPQVFLGSVPARKAMVTGLAQVPDAERATGTTTTPSGIEKSSTGFPASVRAAAHTEALANSHAFSRALVSPKSAMTRSLSIGMRQ